MKKGFTLAEVLITLAIIGVVAALTVPNLIAGYNEKVMLTSLQNTYSSVKNAVTKAAADEDTGSFYDTKYWNKEQGAFFKDYLGTDHSYSDAESDTGFVSYYKSANGSRDVSIDDIIGTDLTQRSSVACSLLETGVGICKNGAEFLVDVNGVKPPNRIGKDLFWFAFDRNGKSIFTDGNQTIGVSAKKSDCMKQVVHAGWKLVNCDPSNE